MAQQQLGLSFRTPTTVTATTEATGFPASNLLLPTKWRRTLRSTSTAAWSVVLDFGAAVVLDGVWVHATNFAKVQLAKSTDNVSYTNLTAAAQDVLADTRCEPPVRRKTWLPATGWTSGFNNRYLRLTPSVADAGATYWEIGAVVCPVLENMTRNWGTPFSWTPVEGVTDLPYAGVGGEVNVEAPTLVRFQLQGGPWMTSAMAQLTRLRALGRRAPFFLYENRGDVTKAYLLERLADPTFGERVTTFDAAWEFEECI